MLAEQPSSTCMLEFILGRECHARFDNCYDLTLASGQCAL